MKTLLVVNGKAADGTNPQPVTLMNSLATDWSYAAAAGGIVATGDVAIKAAAGAGLKNYLTSIDIANAHATVATEVVIKDGATIIWRGFFAAVNVGARAIVFATPLHSTANTALNVACITTGAAVYVNAQGYVAA